MSFEKEMPRKVYYQWHIYNKGVTVNRNLIKILPSHYLGTIVGPSLSKYYLHSIILYDIQVEISKLFISAVREHSMGNEEMFFFLQTLLKSFLSSYF